MSGWWIKIGDTHIRCDRPEHGRDDAPWEMALCLTRLYTSDHIDEPQLLTDEDLSDKGTDHHA